MLVGSTPVVHELSALAPLNATAIKANNIFLDIDSIRIYKL
jgi:hypothetical protein